MKYKLTKVDIEIIKEETYKRLALEIESAEWVEKSIDVWQDVVIGGGSIVVDCHIHDSKEYDPDEDDKIYVIIYDTYVNETDHRVTDTSTELGTYTITWRIK